MSEKTKQLAEFILGPKGRMVGSSKSIYRYDHPNHWVVFNANILNLESQKIWYGDLDITTDLHKLRSLAEQLGTLFVLTEMDARFEWETKPNMDRPVLTILRIAEEISYRFDEQHYAWKNNTLIQLPLPAPTPPTKEELQEKQFIADTNNRQEDFEEIGEVDLNALRKLKSKENPLEAFWAQVRKMYPELKEVTEVTVTLELDELLDTLMLQWVRKYETNLHPAKQSQSVQYEMLMYGPSVFYPCTPVWASGPNFKVYRYIGE